MRFINVRNEELRIGENNVGVSSHDSLADEGQHAVRILLPHGNEVAMVSPTRGEALIELANFFKELAFGLRQMAFAQEGAVEIPKPDRKRPRGGGV